MSVRRGYYIPKNGLILYLDAANSSSYISGSLTWSNMMTSSNNFALTGFSVIPQYTSSGPTTCFTTYFLTASTYSQSYFKAINPTTELLNLPYNDHTIEIIFNTHAFDVVLNYSASLTVENSMCVIGWPGGNSSLIITSGSSFPVTYTIFNNSTGSNVTCTSANTITSSNKSYHIIAMRSGSNAYLYINGILKASSLNFSALTAYPYNSFLIGSQQFTYLPVSNIGTYASNLDFYSIRIYNRYLSNYELSNSFLQTKTRFNI